jgi:hypothetical protein
MLMVAWRAGIQVWLQDQRLQHCDCLLMGCDCHHLTEVPGAVLGLAARLPPGTARAQNLCHCWPEYNAGEGMMHQC